MMERVVANRSLHRGEVEAIYHIAVSVQERRHLAKQAALGIEHDIGSVALQQVGLEEVARLARARAAENEHVIVQPGCP